jgi:hypothetical protein
MNSLHVEQLPLVLAGPILRRTEPESVAVWLALKQACQVKFIVRDTFDGGERLGERILLAGQSDSIRLGAHFHLVMVTATPHLGGRLEPDHLYAYDLSFKLHTTTIQRSTHAIEDNFSIPETVSLQGALRSAGLPNLLISYFTHGLPTFSLPPRDLSQLRIVHGSCRRIHDHEHDALPILDLAIAHAAHSPNSRPHQLFFTGDQIYGDEVAEPFLWGVQQMVQTLFGWQEVLWGEDGQAIPPEQLEPGHRQFIAEQWAGLTASHQGKPEKTRSHLLRFAEYAIAYLFSWSDCPWLLPFPTGTAVGLSQKQAQYWDKQVADIQQFARSQSYVRRALANIPSYMICDDHDVSDDWNLNQAWCLRVLSKPLGRQVVQNAMLAYALFQGWGNTPEQFVEPGPGALLLQATQQWCQRQGNCQTSAQQIARSLGLPPSDPSTGFPKFQTEEDVFALEHPADSL